METQERYIDETKQDYTKSLTNRGKILGKRRRIRTDQVRG